MGKKNTTLATVEETWFTDIQKPMPEKTHSYTGTEIRHPLSAEEEAQFMENKVLALAAMTKAFIQEFQCVHPSEKFFVKRLEYNYGLIGIYQEKLELALDRDLTRSNSQTLKSIHALERGLDNCERRIIRIMQMLRVMKQPPIKVNVIGNAIIGQNQQLNSIHEKSLT